MSEKYINLDWFGPFLQFGIEENVVKILFDEISLTDVKDLSKFIFNELSNIGSTIKNLSKTAPISNSQVHIVIFFNWDNRYQRNITLLISRISWTSYLFSQVYFILLCSYVALVLIFFLVCSSQSIPLSMEMEQCLLNRLRCCSDLSLDFNIHIE